jgi:transposase
MTHTTIHRKKNGAAYIYSVESYWDKEKKAPRNKQVCLGRLDEQTGEIIASKRKKRAAQTETEAAPKASVKVYGPSLLLDKVANEIGLSKLLKKSMPNLYKEVLSLVYYTVQKGQALSRCERWSESHKHPADKDISSQQVSELLKEITEDQRQHFLEMWMGQLAENELLFYDLTSISSYAVGNEYVRRGYNRDNENLPQINLAMLYGQKSGLPAYYRRLPGNITDVVTLQTTMESLRFLGQEKLHFVLDRGFYSEENVNALFEKRYHFILMTPTNRLWVRNIIDQHAEQMMHPERYRETGEDEVLYMASHLHKWGTRRCYLHLYYNAKRAAEDFDKLTKKLLICKDELEKQTPQEAHAEFYERFFRIKKTPIRGLSVEYNDDEIQKYRKRYAGFFCILTNMKMDSGELLECYRNRDMVENCFDDLKNSLDMNRLRVHSSVSMDSRLFIQFLAVVLMSKIRIVAKQSKELRFMSVRDIMETMESVVRITHPDRYSDVISEVGPLQRKIVDAFALIL